jgi:hypothetical protein
MPGRVASPWPRRATCTGCRVCSDNDPGSRHRSSPPVLLGSSLLAAPFPLSGRVRRMSAMQSGIGRFLRWAYLRAIRLSTPCFSSSLAKLLMLGDPPLGATDSLLPRRIVPWQRDALSACLGSGTQVSELLARLLTRQSAADATAVTVPPLRIFKRRSGMRMVTFKAMALSPNLNAAFAPFRRRLRIYDPAALSTHRVLPTVQICDGWPRAPRRARGWSLPSSCAICSDEKEGEPRQQEPTAALPAIHAQHSSRPPLK